MDSPVNELMYLFSLFLIKKTLTQEFLMTSLAQHCNDVDGSN